MYTYGEKGAQVRVKVYTYGERPFDKIMRYFAQVTEMQSFNCIFSYNSGL